MLLFALVGCASTPTIDGGVRDAGDHPLNGIGVESALELEILLTQAAEAGDVEQVKALLAKGADPDGISGTKARVYRYANGLGDKWLGVRVQATPMMAVLQSERSEESYYTPKHEPAIIAEVIELLLRGGADSDIQGGMGVSALWMAIEIKQLACIKLLVEAGADVNISLEGFTQIDIHRTDATTPLARAIQTENIEIIRYLLDAEANPYDYGWGMNALSRAAGRHNPDILELLLTHMDETYGLDALTLSQALAELIREWPDDHWIKPQHEPRYRADWFDCFVLLAEYGANLEGVQRQSLLPYYLKDIEQPMFNAWAKHAGRQGLDGDSHPKKTLFDILALGDIDALRKAFEQGLDPNQLDYSFDLEPYHLLLLELYGYEEPEASKLVKLFVEHGFDLGIRDEIDGRTLLHIAVVEFPSLVPYLLEKAAPVNAEDHEGRTPLDYLSEDEDRQLVELLMGKGARNGNPIDPPRPNVVNDTPSKPNPRMQGLMGPALRDETFEQIVAEQRYLHPVDGLKPYRPSDFKIGKVIRYDLGGGRLAYLAFDEEKDASGRSRFVLFRSDGAMLPGRPGEEWRLRHEDVVDLDADGVKELLIDVTFRDGQTKIGGLRVVSMDKPKKEQWVVLYPHRNEPAGFDWQVGEEHWRSKTRNIEFGPTDGSGKPLWSVWEMKHDDNWLNKRFKDDDFFVQIKPLPIVLDRDDSERYTVGDSAAWLAHRLYHARYD
ncbi:MAG: ankyrin repeat domain-containing protein [Planctomycetota bacterium]